MKILLAIDDSDYSEQAVKEVASRPWPSNSTARVLAVLEKVHPSVLEVITEHGVEGVAEAARKAAEKLTARAVASLQAGGLRAEAAIRDGDPKSSIVEESKLWGASLVVVGSHGMTGIRRLLIGSVAEYVVRNAPCSVEVVRVPTGQN